MVRGEAQGLVRRAVVAERVAVEPTGTSELTRSDATARSDADAAARNARKRHPLLQRGMRTAEVWGDCVGDLQASVTALSLISPLTMHGQRSQRGRSLLESDNTGFEMTSDRFESRFGVLDSGYDGV